MLATLTYRLASYWAPLAAGPVAYGVFKLRYRDNRLSPLREPQSCHPRWWHKPLRKGDHARRSDGSGIGGSYRIRTSA